MSTPYRLRISYDAQCECLCFSLYSISATWKLRSVLRKSAMQANVYRCFSYKQTSSHYDDYQLCNI